MPPVKVDRVVTVLVGAITVGPHGANGWHADEENGLSHGPRGERPESLPPCVFAGMLMPPMSLGASLVRCVGTTEVGTQAIAFADNAS